MHRHQSLLDEAPANIEEAVAADDVFPHNIAFQQQDFLNDFDKMGHQEYGVICCFSVTKWIHLNHGDCGLIRFFRKVFQVLESGGLFILEPQPWRSYKKKKAKNMSASSRENFKGIELKPGDFPNFLVEEIGFVDLKQLSPNAKKTGNTGFQTRPIYMLQKPHNTDARIPESVRAAGIRS